jgi:hypothetical protein
MGSENAGLALPPYGLRFRIGQLLARYRLGALESCVSVVDARMLAYLSRARQNGLFPLGFQGKLTPSS